jgi:hypothetical protein
MPSPKRRAKTYIPHSIVPPAKAEQWAASRVRIRERLAVLGRAGLIGPPLAWHSEAPHA